MLIDVSIRCPACGKDTIIPVASPDPDGRGQRGSRVPCPICRVRLLTLTFADGSVQVQKFSDGLTAGIRRDERYQIPSPFALSDIMRIPPKVWQPRADLIEQFNHRPEWMASLQMALREKQSQPRPLSVPRRIFVSYRWNTPDSDAWVERLVNRLTARGNFVVFDKKAQREKEMLSVPELVSRIADSHMMIAVLDSGYVERIVPRERGQSPEGWVWDEFQTALAFARVGLIKIIGLLRDDTPLPSGFAPFRSDHPGNTFDVRIEENLDKVVELFFRQTGLAPDAVRATRAMELLDASVAAEKQGDLVTADLCAADAAEIAPEVPDGHARRARTAYLARQIHLSFSAAQRTLEIDPGNDAGLLYGAAAAGDLANWKDCIRLARTGIERDRGNHNFRYSMGRALSAFEQYEPAVAHLNSARAGLPEGVQIHRDAAMAYRKMGRSGEAVDCLITALRYAGEAAQESLLELLCVAAIELCNGKLASQTIESLAHKFPDNSNLKLLVGLLTGMLLNNEPLRVFGEFARHRDDEIGTILCSECDAEVRYFSEEDYLCAGCGALLEPPHDLKSCKYCGAEGKMVPAVLPMFTCPYCETGKLKIATAAD